MKLKRKNGIILGILFIFGVIIALWVWFTWPITVGKAIQGREPTNLQISYQSATKDGVTATTIQTENADEMKKAINKLNQYPYSRRLFADSPSKQSRYSDRNTIWISLEYENESDKLEIYTVLIHEDGSMQTADSGEALRYAGMGRFGTQKTKAAYADLKAVFAQLENSPTWERTMDAD